MIKKITHESRLWKIRHIHNWLRDLRDNSCGTICECYEQEGSCNRGKDHIGGNCHDYFNKDVWKYVSQFTEWIDYEYKVLNHVDWKLVSIPVNRGTVNNIFGLSIQFKRKACLATRICFFVCALTLYYYYMKTG